MDIFHRPGECDLTANVDFAYLKEAMKGLGVYCLLIPMCIALHGGCLTHFCADAVTPHGPLTQAVFLERMGLQLRVEALTRAALTEDRKAAIADAARRLVDLTGMGTAYQVLGVTGDGAGGSEGGGGSQDAWPFVNATG